MPELPEVETIVRGLRKVLVGRTFQSVRSIAPPTSIVISKSLGKQTLNSALSGRKILALDRRGKNILISLSGDITLWVHLKMTGGFHYVDTRTPRDKHDLVIFDLIVTKPSDEHYHLRFHDYRRFGRLRVYDNAELWLQKGLADLGPEPLEIRRQEFVDLCRSHDRMIKPALLDQTFIAGIGNIYTDETLYRSRIHPRRTTASLSVRKLVELHYHIQHLLKKSIKHMGTTIDMYSGVNGNPGGFQKYLRVYFREGKPCGRCGRKIVREKISSRSTYFCPRCQRAR